MLRRRAVVATGGHAKPRDEGPVGSDPAAAAKEQARHASYRRPEPPLRGKSPPARSNPAPESRLATK
ncbi:hypothetical protein GCM10009629_07820 [Pseudonocardia alni]